MIASGNNVALEGVQGSVSKYRIALPVCMGLVATGLMAWEHHNSEVIATMGMAWDTGAPMWPYQTPEIILAILNAPAYFLAAPVWFTLDLRLESQRYPALFFAILLLWTGIGKAIDSNLLSRARRRGGKLSTIGLLIATVVFSLTGVGTLVPGMHWWSQYGEPSLVSVLIFARITSFAPWCFILAVTPLRAVSLGLRRRTIDESHHDS
jgi:hypothetical protein